MKRLKQIQKGKNSHQKNIKKLSNPKCNESIKEDINMNDKDDHLLLYNNQIANEDKELILKINEIIDVDCQNIFNEECIINETELNIIKEQKHEYSIESSSLNYYK